MNNPLELTVMMYHYIRDPGDAAEAGSGISGLSVNTFESQVEELAKHHTLVTWSDVQRLYKETGTCRHPPVCSPSTMGCVITISMLSVFCGAEISPVCFSS